MSLITSIDTFKPHVIFDADMKLAVLQPHINFVERYIKAVIGTGQFLALQAAVKLDNATAEQEALLEAIYPALCKLATAAWTEEGLLSMSQQGMRRVETQNEKTAFKYQEDSVRQSLILRGFTLLEDIATFLEENENAYPLWVADTAAYTRFRKFFINSTAEFQEEYNIHNSSLTFKAMYGLMKHVDYLKVGSVLGMGLYGVIKNELLAGNVSEENELLLKEYIRPAVAHLTIAEACNALAVDVSEGGVRVIEMMQTYPSNLITKTASRDLKEPVIDQANAKGKQYLQLMTDYLKANASSTVYTAYFNEKGTAIGTKGNADKTRKVYRA